jgi:hypothetical protein
MIIFSGFFLLLVVCYNYVFLKKLVEEVGSTLLEKGGLGKSPGDGVPRREEFPQEGC